MPADHGDRGAQFVTRIGDEPAQPYLAGLPAVQRRLDVLEHVVERCGQCADLGVRVRFRRARGHRHRSARQRQIGDLSCGVGHPVQWAEREPDGERAAHRDEQQRGAEHDRLDADQPRDGVIDLSGRQSRDEQVAVPAFADEHPVVPEAGQIHRVHRTAGPERREHRPGRGAGRDGRVVEGSADDAGRGHPSVLDARPERAGGLAGYPAELRVVVRVRVAVFEVCGVPGACGAELLIEAIGQEAAQLERGGQRDEQEPDREQRDEQRDEFRAKRVPASQVHDAGLST
jgi:hypothetical protein